MAGRRSPVSEPGSVDAPADGPRSGLAWAARRSRVMATTAAVVVALAVVASPGSAAPSRALVARSALNGTLVRTNKGWVLGSASSSLRTWFGIPFAQPTSGALRFHAPMPVAPWGIRLAWFHSSPCAQELISTDEDCLGLDVYAPPATASRHLPVMVWFYGGAYVLGWNSMYDPAPLVATGKVIVVTVNYRVGPFGFLALPGLESESPTGQASGDYGLMDQHAGLSWVRRNIAAFGGDPHDVTIFGESAGGNSVCTQVASPLGAGLFEHAISESGFCGANTGLDVVSQQTMIGRSEAYASRLGCADVATMVSCLRALPARKLLSDPSVTFGSGTGTWVPDVDGYVLPQTLQDAWTSGDFNHVPIIIGSNLNEGRLFAFLEELSQLGRLTAAEYTAYLQQTFGAQAGAVLAQYPISAYGAPDLAMGQVFTDSAFACTTNQEAREASARGQPIWQYEFADPDPPGSNIDPFMNLGDFHASELSYLFGGALTPAEEGLSTQMINAWTTFAATGQPSPIGTAAWPQFSDASPQTMVLTSDGSHLITSFAAEHKCGFWDGLNGG